MTNMKQTQEQKAVTNPIGNMLANAALMLPGVIVGSSVAMTAMLPADVHAETPPEQATIAFKYLNYEESQASLKRINVNSPSMSLSLPIAGEWLLQTSLTSDSVSGASPRYHTAVSGASGMNDHRKAGDASITRYFPTGSLTVGTAYSTEHDYVSQALSVQGSLSSDDKNTTWLAGLGYAKDKINPVNNIVVNERRKTLDIMLGLTRILTPQDIAQITLTHARGDGYYSDPYKALDNRPRERRQTALMLRWNHHFAASEGSSRISYRYYSDSYDVKAHTLLGEYVQPLAGGWTVTPSLRLYSQSAASFYFDPVYDSKLGAPFPPGYVFGSNQLLTADQRLSGFGAVALGFKVGKQLGKDWRMDVRLEQYEQRGNWRLFHRGSPGLEPLTARSVQVGFEHQW